MLLGADIVAIVAAFAVAIEISGGRLHMGRICLVGLPLVVLGAKLFGLYDRDEAVIRKTTLDELPKLVRWLPCARSWHGWPSDRSATACSPTAMSFFCGSPW